MYIVFFFLIEISAKGSRFWKYKGHFLFDIKFLLYVFIKFSTFY